MIVYLEVVLKCKCIFIILVDGVRWSGGVGLHHADRGVELKPWEGIIETGGD
jgi:hypothetical protein